MLDDIATIVRQQTLLASHWKLVAHRYDGTAYRSPGRPSTACAIEAVVVRSAEENRDWGYRRIQGALCNLSHALTRSTIAGILEHDGLEPPPERMRKRTWKEFVQHHWALIMVTDFFTVGVWTRRGWQRFMVLFFIDPSTPKVEIAGIAPVVNRLWMTRSHEISRTRRRDLEGKAVPDS